MRTRFIGIALTTLTLIMTAHADVMFIRSQIGGGLTTIQTTRGEPAVAPCATPTSPNCTPIIGRAGSSPVDILFTSNTDTLIPTGGQAAIEAVPRNSLIHNFTLSTPGFGYRTLVVNPDRPAEVNGITYTVKACTPNLPEAGSCGNVEVFTETYAPSLTGANWLSMTTGNTNERIFEVSADSVKGFLSFNQIRIDVNEISVIPPIGGDEVPEPSSMLLLGSGVLVFTQVLRRKLKLGFGTGKA